MLGAASRAVGSLALQRTEILVGLTVICGHRVLHQTRQGGDIHQRIVDLVADARRHLADCGQALRLLHRLLGLVALDLGTLEIVDQIVERPPGAAHFITARAPIAQRRVTVGIAGDHAGQVLHRP